MSAFIGRLIQVGLVKESTRGTSNITPPDFWLDKMDATVEDKPVVIIDESTVGRIEDSVGGKVVSEGAEGDISGKVFDKSIGLLLLSAFGTEDTVVVKSAEVAFEHSFPVKNDAQHQSLCIELKNPNEQLAFVLAMIESLEMRAEVGKYVEFTARFLSKKGIASTSTPSYLVENDFLSKHLTVKVADNIAGLDAASAVPMKSATIRINKNLERDDVLGSLGPADILNKQFGIEVVLTRLYKDTTYKSLFASGSTKAIRLEMKNTDVQLGTSAFYPTLTFDLAQALLTAWEKTTGAEELSAETITGKATYKKTEAKMVDCKLINSQSAKY